MAELERSLRDLAAGLEWPPTPALSPALAPRRRRDRVRPVWVAAAAVLVALATALAVPGARSALLRVFHLGGVSVERVATLPSARERPLAAGLGPTVSEQEAEAALGTAPLLPKLPQRPPLHLRNGVVSLLLTAPSPVLLSEVRSEGGVFFKKIAGGATHVVGVSVDGGPGLWIAGGTHVLVLPAPARLAGNVLVWERGGITFRLEGRFLTQALALTLAGSLTGT
ncbi:MAG TPA: hypothetical protein VFA30_08885 [Gaiellaceae bacterium]|nr:hypothetical protein [Gaiellaceae bacterium]